MCFVAIILDQTSDVMSRSSLPTLSCFVHISKVHELFAIFTDVHASQTYGLLEKVEKGYEGSRGFSYSR